MRRSLITHFVWTFFIGVLWIGSSELRAAQVNEVYEIPLSGLTATGQLTVANGKLYGTANGGVYSINPDGSQYLPIPLLRLITPTSIVVSDSTIYGGYYFDDQSGYGSIFKVQANGTGFTRLVEFDDQSASQHPLQLFMVGDTLYGRSLGGSPYANVMYTTGTVFKLNTDGTGYSTVLPQSFAEYSYFNAVLTPSRTPGEFYVANSTYYGGGQIYKLNAFDETVSPMLHIMDDANADGAEYASPKGTLALDGNQIYGTASGSNIPQGPGKLYRMNDDGTDFSILHTFPIGEGLSSPVVVGSKMYGIASNVIYSIDKSGANYKELYALTGQPSTDLVYYNSRLYGATSTGGAFGNGMIYSFDVGPTPEPSTLALAATGVMFLGAMRGKITRRLQRTRQSRD